MHARNAGLQRLRSVTKRVGIAMTVLAGAFAVIAAAGNSGHNKRATVRTRTTSSPATRAVPAPPALPPIQGDEASPAPPASTPAPPQQPPAQTQAPPVVASGGS